MIDINTTCDHLDPASPILSAKAETTTDTGPYGEAERLFHVIRFCPICHHRFYQTYDYDFAEHYHFQSVL